MKVILVDDEALLLQEMERLLEGYLDIEVAGCYTNPLEALKEIEHTRPELAFLDIEMRTLNGIELAERLLERMPELDILFVTAYDHYAVEAFEVNAIDYILKPVRPERLQKAMDRIRKKRKSLPTGQLLSIRFFGKFGVFYGEEAIKFNRSKTRELFAYLLANEGSWMDKFRICDELWPETDSKKALANLQTAVWAIRKCLRGYGISQPQILYADDSYLIHAKEAVWDIRRYDEARLACVESGSSAAGRVAEALYAEGYLAYEDWNWIIERRARYAIEHEALLGKVHHLDEK